MNKISTKVIAIVFVALVTGVYFAYQFVAAKLIDSKHFAEILPGKVTLLGIDVGAKGQSDLGMGYKILVSNGIAQLVQVPTSKLQTSNEAMGDEDADATDKRRIPLKAAIEALQGNAKSLGELVVEMNDELRKARDQITPTAAVWRAEDIQKAIDGDQKLRSKLESDLNTKLDGTPENFINQNSLYSGITLDIPVPAQVSVQGRPVRLVARVQLPYRVAFTEKVTNDLNGKGLNPTPQMIAGYYRQEAQKVLAENSKENVASALKSRFDAAKVKTYADAAERVLGRTKVILNESFIQSASSDEASTASGKSIYNLNLTLTEEGRERLWQYSRHRVGTQLLFIVDGVAIAAPTVRHELAQRNVTITQMSDPSLVQDALDVIQKNNASTVSEVKATASQ